MIDAVIFDLGNVLAFHDNDKLFAELSRLFHADIRARAFGSGLWEAVNKGRFKGDALRRELVARTGVEVSAEDFERAWSCHFTLNPPMIRHAEALVGKVKLALLSNTHDLHVKHLRPQLPVLERFDALILSCECGAMKPEEAIYRRALDALDVEPQRAVFFDDLEPYVRAAEKYGLHARVFRSAADVPGQLAELGLNVLRSAAKG
jgi:putative hydrolase of the HAD superfamily